MCIVVMDHVHFFFCNETATTDIYTYLHPLSLHDALPISPAARSAAGRRSRVRTVADGHADLEHARHRLHAGQCPRAGDGVVAPSRGADAAPRQPSHRPRHAAECRMSPRRRRGRLRAVPATRSDASEYPPAPAAYTPPHAPPP